MPYSLNEIKRFWTKVTVLPDLDLCWPWRGYCYPTGYGKFALNSRKFFRAHRVAYEMAYGEIPEGLDVCHRCDNPRCCNPAHLFPGTQQDNYADCVAKGRNRGASGERNAHARLRSEQVVEIRAKKEAGASYRELACEYGVRKGTIWFIVKRRTWL